MLRVKPSDIGYTLAAGAVIGALLPIAVFPGLQRKYKNVSLYTSLLAIYPIVFLLFPLVNLVARWGANVNGDFGSATNALVWVGICVILLCGRFAGMTWS